MQAVNVQATAAAENRVRIDCKGLHYREVNERVNAAADAGATRIILDNVNGHRYIGTGVNRAGVKIEVHGTAGGDLATFLDGPEIEVFGNAQDAAGNTMNAGKVIVHGDAGNATGLSMRGGRLYVRGHVGYRVGIHCKAYQEHFPVLIIGGTAGDFLGEYMAGGRLILLGLDAREGQPITGDFVGTGMHGGVMFLRGQVDKNRLGKEVGIVEMTDEDRAALRSDLEDFARCFKLNADELMAGTWTKLVPLSTRPYGKLYVY